MRNRSLTKIFDKFFWFLLTIFPLLYALIASAQTGLSAESLSAFLKDIILINPNSIVYTILDWYAQNVPQLGIDTANVLWLCVAWMFTVEIMHLILDLILFIFKLVRRLFDKVGAVE